MGAAARISAKAAGRMQLFFPGPVFRPVPGLLFVPLPVQARWVLWEAFSVQQQVSQRALLAVPEFPRMALGFPAA
jgi:hypothetical protein